MTERTKTLESLFLEAKQRDPGSERDQFLSELDLNDPALGLELRNLLEADARSERFFGGISALVGNAPDGMAATMDSGVGHDSIGSPSAKLGVGSRMGPYKLLEPIGEGGMGLVYLAQQSKPIRRKVALKIIKPGMDSRQVIARFEAERQALAMMDHPNIAKVLDAGTTETGLPYFVMELVRGIPMTEYCDQARMPTRERLRLFQDACSAIQHAHNKGVIHRDIKPSNILLTEQDGEPLVKVIDFGIAKALTDNLTDKTMFTGMFQMMGTPLYMSPEQASLSNVDVDTRSDVYSLGVMLYELLSGTLPIDRDEIKELSFDELRQRICETEPLRPSKRLSTLEDAARETVAERRGVDTKLIHRVVSNELDWIIMKAIEKDRSRRYQSARELSGDLERYLKGEPVEACPPSIRYRTLKYIAKNRYLLSTVAVIFLALLAGFSIALWQRSRAIAARNEAEDNLQSALDTVDRLLAIVSDEELAQFPGAQPARRKMMEKAVSFYKHFSESIGDSPGIQLAAAETWAKLGVLAQDLGEDDFAKEHFKESLAMFDELVKENPNDDELRLSWLTRLREAGFVYLHSKDFESAEKLFSMAAEGSRELTAKGVGNAAWLHQASLSGRLTSLRHLKRHDAYKQLAEELRRLVDINPDINAHGILPQLARFEQDKNKADALWVKAIEACRRACAPDDHRDSQAYFARQLLHAAIHFRTRDPEFAEKLLDEAAEVSHDLVKKFPNIQVFSRLHNDVQHHMNVHHRSATAPAPDREPVSDGSRG